MTGSRRGIKTQLAGLTTAEQALVIAVLHNNAAHLGTNAATVIATIAPLWQSIRRLPQPSC